MSKGLNSTDGENRIRFEKLSEKLRRINVDVIHRVNTTNEGGFTENPITGEKGCFYQDHLQHWKPLEITAHFKR